MRSRLAQQVARMSTATCGIDRREISPGCRFAHPGYACSDGNPFEGADGVRWTSRASKIAFWQLATLQLMIVKLGWGKLGAKMAEGGWVVLGSAIGTIGSILTTWLAAHLGKEKPDPWDGIAMNLLQKQLEIEKWCEIGTLANIIGLDTKTTREYLILLKARGSRKDGKKWGLLSRNPLEADDEF